MSMLSGMMVSGSEGVEITNTGTCPTIQLDGIHAAPSFKDVPSLLDLLRTDMALRAVRHAEYPLAVELARMADPSALCSTRWCTAP